MNTPAAGPEAASTDCHHSFRDGRPRTAGRVVTGAKHAELHPSPRLRNRARVRRTARAPRVHTTGRRTLPQPGEQSPFLSDT